MNDDFRGSTVKEAMAKAARAPSPWTDVKGGANCAALGRALNAARSDVSSIKRDIESLANAARKAEREALSASTTGIAAIFASAAIIFAQGATRLGPLVLRPITPADIAMLNALAASLFQVEVSMQAMRQKSSEADRLRRGAQSARRSVQSLERRIGRVARQYAAECELRPGV